MNQLRIALLFTALFLASLRRPTRKPWPGPRHITAIDGNMLSVKSREGQESQDRARTERDFAYMKALKLSDIAPGTPLGTAPVKGPDGKTSA